ncbi:MAG: CBS domain-containing protein [Phycisphaerales bacterium]|nr:MAG: CBS domain-containing protein [Phycisphaerales bacterium]
MPTKTKTRTVIQAKDVMTPNPVCVSRAATIRELAEVLDGNDISGAPVINGNGRLVGVVSQTDMIHRCVEGPLGSRQDSIFAALAEGLTADVDPEELGLVEDFMSEDPVTAHPDDPVADIAHAMAEEQVHRVVVVDGQDRPVGIVTALDMLAVFPRG